MTGKKSDQKAGEADRRRLELAKELREALGRDAALDYERLRADLDAVADPSPKDWYAWHASTDRHLRLAGLNEAEMCRLAPGLAASALTIAELSGGQHVVKEDVEKKRRQGSLRQVEARIEVLPSISRALRLTASSTQPSHGLS